jgi:hypothetical protein
VAEQWSHVRKAITHRSWKGIIVLDDGGLCAAAVPGEISASLPVIGVEQTMAGVREPYPVIPVVEVASSAAKTILEPPMIREAVWKRLLAKGYLSTGGSRYGVVGIGNIGKAVARALATSGQPVYVYDSQRDVARYGDVPGSITCNRLEELFEQSDHIFGCSGTDILAGQTWWRGLKGDKILVSCSSHDEEFRTALLALNEQPAPNDTLADVRVHLDNGSLLIVRGGCPANFDGTQESVPREDIQLTRALLLAGVLQSSKLSEALWKCSSARIMLSPDIQQSIVASWRKLRGDTGWYSPETLAVFDSPESIAARSGGTPARLGERKKRSASAVCP